MHEGHQADGGNARGTVLWHVTMSLDGFIAGRHDSMDWMTGSTTSLADEVIQTTGAVLAGRRGYEIGRRPGSKQGGTFTFVTEGIEGALQRARAAAGERDVCLMGADIARQCLRAGLLDELHIHLAPVLIGAGTRLFDRLDAGHIELRRTSVIESPYVTHLRFCVVK